MFSCIFIPDFPAAAILRCESDLRAQAVAVLAGRPPLEKVVSMNEAARDLGVEMGATKAQLEAWEELVLRARSEAQEASAHAAMLDCAQAFSPEVEDTAPDTVLLNLAGLELLLGPFSKIANDLAHRLADAGLEANVAVAANPDAALLAARGFRGVTLIPKGHEAQCLGDLPVDVLLESFSSDTQEAATRLEMFDRWGIRSLRALAALPEVPVSERLGQQGIHLQKLARGEVSRSLRLLDPPPVFADSVELEHPIVLLEPLAFLLNHLLEQVCAKLAERALAAQELKLQLKLVSQFEDCEPQPASTFTRTIRLPVPMLDARVFLKLLQLDLQAHPPGAPIVKIHLSAEAARPRTSQGGLFQPVFPEPEKLELTLARISGIVGEGRVGSPALLDTHREGAFIMRHFAPVEPEMSKLSKKSCFVSEQSECRTENSESVSENSEFASGRSPECSHDRERAALHGREIDPEDDAQTKMTAVIAMRLFRPSLRAVVSMREGKPLHLRCPDREDIAGEIIWSAGPWRSSGDWAEQEGWSREEWDIAVPAASGLVLYRLVQDKLNAKWFVEGVYD